VNPELANLLLQVSLVGAFIWFSLESQKRFSAALEKRDEEYSKRNDKVCDSMAAQTAQIVALTRELVQHDANTKPAVDAILRDATDEPKSRPRRRKDDSQ